MDLSVPFYTFRAFQRTLRCSTEWSLKKLFPQTFLPMRLQLVVLEGFWHVHLHINCPFPLKIWAINRDICQLPMCNNIIFIHLSW